MNNFPCLWFLIKLKGHYLFCRSLSRLYRANWVSSTIVHLKIFQIWWSIFSIFETIQAILLRRARIRPSCKRPLVRSGRRTMIFSMHQISRSEAQHYIYISRWTYNIQSSECIANSVGMKMWPLSSVRILTVPNPCFHEFSEATDDIGWREPLLGPNFDSFFARGKEGYLILLGSIVADE